MKETTKVAAVTGASRGIGLEICRQLADKGMDVVLTARNANKGEKARAKIGSDQVIFHPLDVTDDQSVATLKQFIEKTFGRLDILINNAGVLLDERTPSLKVGTDILKKTMEVNVYGALRMCQAFLPMMQKQKSGRIVNVSSSMGALNSMGGGYLAYRVSKTALNAMTRVIATDVHEKDIQINTMDPGWVKTDMGGPNATLSVEDGADTAVWLALRPKGNPTGRFFAQRREVAW